MFSKSLNKFLIVKAAVVALYKKEKALVGIFSGHCETSRMLVDSSSVKTDSNHTV